MDHRIYFDEDSLAYAVIAPIRAAGVDCLLTSEAGRLESPDPDQLAFATERGMIIFTGNQGHFAALHKRWLESGRHHAGIIICRRDVMDFGTQIRALTRLLNAVPPEDFIDRIEYLRRWVTLA
ncbi:MAG: DUF5615 family PIN-like protein [Tepidiformaceae bacterium]